MGMMGWDRSQKQQTTCFSRWFGFQWEKLQDEYISFHGMIFVVEVFVSFRFSILE